MPARTRESKEEKQSSSKAHRSEAARTLKQQQLATFTSDINAIVLEAVQKSIQSASVHAAQRKRLLQLLIPASADVQRFASFDDEEVKQTAIASLRDVVLNRLPIPTAADSLKRFTMFLSELCRNYGRETKALSGTYLDDVPATIIECLVGYHNAKDKQVRLMVCTLIQALLATLSDAVPRDALYAALTNALKDRCFDKCPMVREKAIAALKAFHLGEKEDDVTQVSIALLCEDVNAKVRESSILSIAKCRSVHLRHLIRMTKDVHSSVRRACWESLATYSIKDQLLGYCYQLGIDLFDVAAAGLKDPSEPVKDACRNTISVAWLQRGFGSNLAAMVDAFFKVPTTINIPSATAVIGYLISTLKDKWTPISITLNPLTPANAMLWKCSVEYFLDNTDDNARHNNTHGGGGDTDPRANPLLSPDDDACGLPLLSKFRIILTAVVNQYAGRTPAPSSTAEAPRTSGLATTIQPEDVKVPPSEENKDAAFVIDLLLSVFDIYGELGMLGHADDTGRNQMIRPLSFLLKVVTIDKPVCFVDDAVKAIKAITERHQGEGNQSIEQALRTLFSLLSIPKKNQLSYEDIEAYARADFERRRRIQVLETQRLQDGEDVVQPDSEEDQLLDDVSTDDAVMLRMCRIVHAYLSCLLRGTDIPSFVTHIIQLGRAQRHVEARSLAMRCLSLHCLINPQTVTTFLPIFMSQSSDATATEVATAAASGLFDMMSEYGPKFFDNTGGSQQPGGTTSQQSPQDPQQPLSLTNRSSTNNNRQDQAEQQRIEIEKLASEDDAYKPGSQVIVKQMMSFLQSPTAELRHLAMFGFCKLLAANRLLPEACVPILARLLHYFVTFEASAVDDKEQLQMHRLVEGFFRGFSFSHPRRQAQVLDAGLLALRLVLNEHVAQNGPTAEVPKLVTKILKRTVNLTDAINVQQVRDVDPDLSAHVAHQSALEVSRLSGTVGDNGLDDSVMSRASKGGNTSSIGNRSVTIRLWRELGKCSLHERLALEVLADVAQFRDNDSIVKVLLQELPLLRLYKRDARLFDNIRQHAEACKVALRQGPSNQADVHCSLIDVFVDGAEKIKAPSLDDSIYSHDANNNMSFGGAGSNDDGMSLAQRNQLRKALADAVHKMIVPVRADGSSTGWLGTSDIVAPASTVAGSTTQASQGTTKAASAKGSKPAAKASAARTAAKVKEEQSNILTKDVVKRRSGK